jgi:hypothetical protein
MDTEKRKRLEAAGWKFGDAAAFLELTPEENELVQIRVALSRLLESKRRGNATQKTLARRIGSSQSRVAKIEANDPSVSLDLMVRAILATGASRKDIAEAIGAD